MTGPSRAARALLTVTVVAATALVGCANGRGSTGGSDEVTSSVATTVPVPAELVPGPSWTAVAPEQRRMDAAKLAAAKTYAFAPGKNTQGVVVVRGAAIVAEWYAPGHDEQSWAASWSVAKSVASALVGIAIGEGKIASLDVPMTTYFPDWAARGLGRVTLRDVMEMSSGLSWNESYSATDGSTSNVIDMVVNQRDQLAYAAARPSVAAPGTQFLYTSGGAMLLSGVIAQATGMSAGEYAQQKLWGPIGATKVDMWRDAAGHTLTYCCVDTTTRDFARFGLLYLRHGDWGGRQVVPRTWVDGSSAGSRAAPKEYGLMWWLSDAEGVPSDMYSARGHDGQYIYVIPSLDLVVVRNGTYVKDDGPPVADPSLFAHYPSGGLVAGRGTTPPDSWSDADFLRPIVDSIS